MILEKEEVVRVVKGNVKREKQTLKMIFKLSAKWELEMRREGITDVQT